MNEVNKVLPKVPIVGDLYKSLSMTPGEFDKPGAIQKVIPPSMPGQTDIKAAERRRAMMEAAQRRGRQSTILTAFDNQPLGG